MLVVLLPADAAYGANLADLQKMVLRNRRIIQKFLINLQKNKNDEIIAASTYYPSVDMSYTVHTLGVLK